MNYIMKKFKPENNSLQRVGFGREVRLIQDGWDLHVCRAHYDAFGQRSILSDDQSCNSDFGAELNLFVTRPSTMSV